MAGVPLGAIGLIGPVFEICREASQGCKLPVSFGADFRKVQRKIESQTAILEELAKLKISALTEDEILQTANVNQVIQILDDMKDDFQKCSELIKKYQGLTSGDPPVEVVNHSSENQSRSLGSSSKNGAAHFDPISKSGPLPLQSKDTNPAGGAVFRKASWAAIDKQAFCGYVDNIQYNNRALQSLIQTGFQTEGSFLSDKEDPAAIGNALPSIKKIPALTHGMVVCEEVVHDLKRDFAAARGPSIPKLDFAVKLYSNHEKAREDLGPFSEVKIRDKSLIFMIQAHKHQNKPESVLLIVDTPWIFSRRKKPMTEVLADMDNVRIQREVRGEAIVDLSSRIHPMNPEASNTFIHLGYIPHQSLVQYSEHTSPAIQPPSPTMLDPERETARSILQKPVLHHIYQDQISEWTVSATLADLLKDQKYRQTLHTHDRISLAILLATSYVTFGFEGRPRVFRAQDCRYYKPLDEDDAEVDNEFILSPYLRLEGGQQKPRRPGRGAGVSTNVNISLIELGLLLYQIGCWTSLEYDHPGGIKALAFETKSKINNIVRYSGSKFASIVQYCLQGLYSTESVDVGIVELEDLDLWPMYGKISNPEILGRWLRGAGRGATRFYAANKMLDNLNVEIYNKVILPLEELEREM